MKTPEHISLPLAKLLDRLSNSLSTCDPENSEAMTRITHDLGELRAGLEHEHTEHLSDIAGLALRLVDDLANHGLVGPRETLEVVEQAIDAVRSRLGLAAHDSATAKVPGKGTPQSTHLALLDGKRIGELLVTLSMLSPEDVERALTLQKQTGMLLGEALVELKILNRGAVESALRLQSARRRRNLQDDPWALPG